MRFILIITLLSFTVASCGGRSAQPIAATTFHDNKMSCEDIMFEATEIQNQLSKLVGEKDDKRGKNVGWGIAGFFFFPLWLGLDLSDAQQTELRALESRSNVLRRLAHKKKCDFVM